MNLDELKQHKKEIEKIAAKYGIRTIAVFGSVARGEAAKSSDIDFLIELAEGVSALGVGGFQYEAEKLLGIKIDVIPTFALKTLPDQAFVNSIQADAIAL